MNIVKNPDDIRFVPHQNEHIKIMLNVSEKVARVLAARAWILSHSRVESLVTSDHPVVWWSKPSESSHLLGYGVANADDVYFPLGRRHLLAMAPAKSIPECVVTLEKEHALFVNHLEAEFSHRWVYQHPEDERIDSLIPRERRPLMYINGKPIFEN